MRSDESKKSLLRGGSDEQHNDMKLSICRNIGSGSNRAGKRKISWQDQVALRVWEVSSIAIEESILSWGYKMDALSCDVLKSSFLL